MANVMELLRKIKTAIYGRDVRQSIYDAILQCYNDATGNPESIAAHTGDTDNPHNVTADQVGLAPVDGVTLSILDGYIKSIVTASGLKTKDTNGLLGEANAEVMLQALIDDITNRVVNQILTKSMLINNGLATEAGKYPLDAAYGKTLLDKITQLNSDLKVTQEFLFNTPTEYLSDKNTQDRTMAYRSGNTITLIFNMKALKALTPFTTYLILPEKYRPTYTLFFPTIESDGQGIRVGSDGTVMVCKAENEGASISTTISYVKSQSTNP